MRSIESNKLLENLQEDVRQIILQSEQLKNIPAQYLEQIPGEGKWSVAQVLGHLNIYCRYYLHAIETKLHHHNTRSSRKFTPGWLGNYFTKLMQPGSGGIIKKKMKAPSNATPSNAPGAGGMLKEFIGHQHHLLNLLRLSGNANLNKNRIPISISRFITLKLGDTFRFLVAHQQRHFIQVENTVEVLKQKQLEKFRFLNANTSQ